MSGNLPKPTKEQLRLARMGRLIYLRAKDSMGRTARQAIKRLYDETPSLKRPDDLNMLHVGVTHWDRLRADVARLWPQVRRPSLEDDDGNPRKS